MNPQKFATTLILVMTEELAQFDLQFKRKRKPFMVKLNHLKDIFCTLR